jgi:uncharacterized protein YbdZ (MbtH family)
MEIDEDSVLKTKVVVNHEEQYSILPSERENPPGWRDAGPSGSKEECLAWIQENWTDMRPLSLRKAMEEVTAELKDSAEPAAASQTTRESLVERLSRGRHPVEAGVGPDGSSASLKENIAGGYVQVRFTNTEGGTELGVTLNSSTDVSDADFEAGLGTVHLVGELVLDFIKVRCIADIELPAMAGEGHLELIEG